MIQEALLKLINNTALLLALSIIYEVVYNIPLKNKNIRSIISGILVGLIGIAVMTNSFMLMPGLTFDTRSILIGVSALIFGPVSAAIASVITIIYRITAGGVGSVTGITVIALSAVIGLLWRLKINNQNLKYRLLWIYLFGINVHIVMLLCLFILPWQTAYKAVLNVSVPVMLIYPVATVLLSALLLRQKERNLAVAKLTEAEERYRSLFDNNNAIMFIIDPVSHSIIDANPAACEFYGWSREEMKTMPMNDINAEIPDIDFFSKKENGNSKHFFFKHRKANGEQVDVEVFSSDIVLNGRTLTHSIVHDISERVASDKALKESESRFRLLVESAPDAIFIITEGKISFVNRATISLFGANSAEELLGTSIIDRVHEDYQGRIRKKIDQYFIDEKPLPPEEGVYIKLDGSMVYVEVTAFPIDFYKDSKSAIVIARDITERKALENSKNEIEAQLRQQQKLESIGTLAGGVAHEINNPIYGIMNYAQLIYDMEDAESSQAEYAYEILRETERISSIVKSLLQFSRHEKQSHSYASVYDIINQTIALINTIIRKDQIRLELDLEENLPDMKCRSQQIQQVVMNLLTNARDALNEKYNDYHDDKVIILRCRLVEYDDRRWIRMTVEDHGNGIPEHIRDKIFEPFFSTKPKEIGTGLGLSISFGIIKDHHGKINIETQEGRFTRFILDLPVDNGWTLEA